MKTSWRELITLVMDSVGEGWGDVEASTLPDKELDEPFENSYGIYRAQEYPFIVWTKRRVYFPVDYDGEASACSVPRNPGDGAAVGE